MPKYIVGVPQTLLKLYEVEAKDQETAIRKVRGDSPESGESFQNRGDLIGTAKVGEYPERAHIIGEVKTKE
jgi:hypothetical protein